MLVTAIVVALAAFAVGGIIGAKQRAAIARGKAELALLAQALEDYKRHYGDYPQTGAAAEAAVTPTALIGSTQAQALLFNALTGLRAKTANFPGTTVERKVGRMYLPKQIVVVDLPGLYSLDSKSPDEKLASDALQGRLDHPMPDAALVVVVPLAGF